MPYKDPDQRREYYRRWKKGEKKRLANRYYDSAKHANQRAAKYGIPGRITTADARAILEGAVCFYCGGDRLMGLDHRIALVNGGANERSNLVACCRSCNASKWRGDRPGQWASYYDACIECGGTEREHSGKGRCRRCYQRQQKRERTGG